MSSSALFDGVISIMLASARMSTKREVLIEWMLWRWIGLLVDYIYD